MTMFAGAEYLMSGLVLLTIATTAAMLRWPAE